MKKLLSSTFLAFLLLCVLCVLCGEVSAQTGTGQPVYPYTAAWLASLNAQTYFPCGFGGGQTKQLQTVFAAIPAGGTVDMTCYQTPVVLTADVFSPVSKPILIWLPESSVTINANATIPSNFMLCKGPGSSYAAGVGYTLTDNSTACGSGGSIPTPTTCPASAESMTGINSLGNAICAPAVAPVTNVIACGADPTGAADSTTAFNTCYTAAPAGSMLVIPAGNFKLTPASSCPNSITAAVCVEKPLNILCLGPVTAFSSGSVLSSTLGTGWIFDLAAGGQDTSIQNCVFTTSAGSVTTGGGVVIDFDAAVDADGQAPAYISGNSFIGVWNGIEVRASNGVQITNNRFDTVKNDAIFLHYPGYAEGPLYIRISGNQVINPGASGVEADNVSGMVDDTNQYYGGIHAMFFDPVSPAGVQYIEISKLTADVNQSDSILFGGTGPIDHVQITDPEINSLTGSFSGGFGVNFGNSQIDGVRMGGGRIRECYKSAIHIGGGKNIRIDPMDLSNNGFQDTGGYGVKVDAGMSYWHVRGVTCGATGGDSNDVGFQAGCVYVAPGASTGWSVLDLVTSGGPVPTGIFGSPMLSGGPWTGFYQLRLKGGGENVNDGGSNAQAGYTLPGADGAGTIAPAGTYSVDLSTYVPTPNPAGYTWPVHGQFDISAGAPGSVVAARINVFKTSDGATASVENNIPTLGSGSISLTGTTVTVTNGSATDTIPYLFKEFEAESDL
jgi:hypothetical protein